MQDKEPQPRGCPYCDFQTGHRGMDWCSRCGGTGSVFYAKNRVFPNTKEGYEAAKALLNAPRE